MLKYYNGNPSVRSYGLPIEGLPL